MQSSAVRTPLKHQEARSRMHLIDNDQPDKLGVGSLVSRFAGDDIPLLWGGDNELRLINLCLRCLSMDAGTSISCLSALSPSVLVTCRCFLTWCTHTHTHTHTLSLSQASVGKKLNLATCLSALPPLSFLLRF